MKRTAAGMTFSLFLSASAYAQMVSVPCQEFVEVTGKPMACDKIPVIKMSQAKWEAEKSAAEERNSPDADIPPWKRPGKAAKSAPETSSANGCDVPPWKRSPGLKCD